MAWNQLPEFGEILRIREVLDRASKLKGHAVRILARLESYDCIKQQAVVSSPERGNDNRHLLVDTRLIEPFEAKQGSMTQFLGEVDCVEDEDQTVLLRARVAKLVDGVDVAMYYKALDGQREFFERRQGTDAENDARANGGTETKNSRD